MDGEFHRVVPFFPVKNKQIERETKMEINITKIFIVLNPYGADLLSLQTDLPPTTPAVSKEKCAMDIRCAKNTGEGYCKENFPGVPIRIISR